MYKKLRLRKFISMEGLYSFEGQYDYKTGN